MPRDGRHTGAPTATALVDSGELLSSPTAAALVASGKPFSSPPVARAPRRGSAVASARSKTTSSQRPQRPPSQSPANSPVAATARARRYLVRRRARPLVAAPVEETRPGAASTSAPVRRGCLPSPSPGSSFAAHLSSRPPAVAGEIVRRRSASTRRPLVRRRGGPLVAAPLGETSRARRRRRRRHAALAVVFAGLRARAAHLIRRRVAAPFLSAPRPSRRRSGRVVVVGPGSPRSPRSSPPSPASSFAAAVHTRDAPSFVAAPQPLVVAPVAEDAPGAASSPALLET